MMIEVRSEEERRLLVEALDLLIDRLAAKRIPGVGLVTGDRHESRKVGLADELADRIRSAQ